LDVDRHHSPETAIDTRARHRPQDARHRARRLAALCALLLGGSVACGLARAVGPECGREAATAPAHCRAAAPPACAASAVSEVPGGIVIRASSAACLRQATPQLRGLIIAATASPSAATAAAAPVAAPARSAESKGMSISRSTANLRTLAVMRAQWQPPPTTSLTTVGGP
jgi:hypothetical protein